MTPHTPTAEEIRAWMAESGGGYRAAAKHFDVKTAQIKAAAPAVVPARAPAGPPAPEPAREGSRRNPTADDIAAMSVLERHVWQMREAVRDLEDLRMNEKAATAIAGMHAKILAIGAALDAERARIDSLNQAPEALMTEEELVRTIAEGIEEVPEEHLGLILDALRARSGGLRLVEGA